MQVFIAFGFTGEGNEGVYTSLEKAKAAFRDLVENWGGNPDEIEYIDNGCGYTEVKTADGTLNSKSYILERELDGRLPN